MTVTVVRVDTWTALRELAMREVATTGRTWLTTFLDIEEGKLCFLNRGTCQSHVVCIMRHHYLLVNGIIGRNSTLGLPFGAYPALFPFNALQRRQRKHRLPARH